MDNEILLRGIKPIQQKFLERNYLFMMQWRKGFLFGKVIDRQINLYKPWPLIDADGTAVIISTSTYSGPYYFRDPRNTINDILYLDINTNAGWPWFLHGSVGIKPQQIYMYLKFPERKDLEGKYPNIDPVRPTLGDDVGYINSLYSPYEEPTDFHEYVIPPRLHMDVEFYNKDENFKHRPVCNLLFATYWFQVLRSDVHRNLIKKMALREIPTAIFRIGFGDFPLDMGSDLVRDWDATLLTLDEASAL